MDVLAKEHVQLQSQVDDLLSRYGKFLGDLVEARQDSDEEAREMVDKHLQHYFKGYCNIKERNKSQALSVAVLALTKSGKSTFLNSLLSTELLPVNNVPETARICKIVHSPIAERAVPMLKLGDTEVEGEEAIRAQLRQLNSAARARGMAAGSAGASETDLLHIFCPVAALEAFKVEDASYQAPRMFLLDTPGPNEAGEEALRFQVERLLDSVDAVIYLLDYTKLKTAEEEAMFVRLKAINPALVLRLATRLFFVVNKVDQAGVAEGLDADATREYVAELVTKQLACEGFQLTADQVLLLSARNALLSRLVLADRAAPETLARFQRVAFGALAPRMSPPLAMLKEFAQEMLSQSGIETLETRVLSFLYTHAASVKQLAIVDDLLRLMAEAQNVASSCRACLEMRVEELKEQSSSLRGDLEQTLANFDDVLRNTDSLQAEVVQEIKGHLFGLKGRIFSYIVNTLDVDSGGAASTVTPAPASAAAVLPAPWQRLHERILAHYSPQGPARSPDRGDVEAALLDLHTQMLELIHNEVREFWAVVEACANGTLATLVGTLNGQLDALACRVERVVGVRLGVQLEHADLSMEAPDAQAFHGDLAALVHKGVVEADEKHIRVSQREFKEPERRQRPGLCAFGRFYYEDVSRTRTVVETYSVTVYKLAPPAVATHFVGLVDAAVSGTEAALAAHVAHFVQRQVSAARTQLTQYCERYLNVVSSSLETSVRDREQRLAALEVVNSHLRTLQQLRAATAAVQTTVEEVVMRGAGAAGAFGDRNALALSSGVDEEMLPLLGDDASDEELVFFDAETMDKERSQAEYITTTPAGKVVEPVPQAMEDDSLASLLASLCVIDSHAAGVQGSSGASTSYGSSGMGVNSSPFTPSSSARDVQSSITEAAADARSAAAAAGEVILGAAVGDLAACEEESVLVTPARDILLQSSLSPRSSGAVSMASTETSAADLRMLQEMHQMPDLDWETVAAASSPDGGEAEEAELEDAEATEARSMDGEHVESESLKALGAGAGLVESGPIRMESGEPLSGAVAGDAVGGEFAPVAKAEPEVARPASEGLDSVSEDYSPRFPAMGASEILVVDCAVQTTMEVEAQEAEAADALLGGVLVPDVPAAAAEVAAEAPPVADITEAAGVVADVAAAEVQVEAGPGSPEGGEGIQQEEVRSELGDGSGSVHVLIGGVPFDYSRGFVSAMSTSGLTFAGDNEDSMHEWEMVDANHAGHSPR